MAGAAGSFRGHGASSPNLNENTARPTDSAFCTLHIYDSTWHEPDNYSAIPLQLRHNLVRPSVGNSNGLQKHITQETMESKKRYPWKAELNLEVKTGPYGLITSHRELLLKRKDSQQVKHMESSQFWVGWLCRAAC